MESASLQISEKHISNTFNSQSGHFDKQDTKGLGKTAEEHVKQITKNKYHTAIDVGSGTGGILEGLLDNQLDFVYGVDLAPKMIKLAQQRLEKKGYTEKSKIENISFLDYSFEKDLDAVSLHRVLCCHPDRQAMLDKAISGNPKLIVLTIPRRWFFMRIALKLVSVLRKIKPGFRPYLHSYKQIDQQLQKSNYQLIDTFKTFIWVTKTYKLY